MNLIIDIGNTSVKIAVFKNDQIIFNNRIESLTVDILHNLLIKYNEINAAIVSCVGICSDSAITYLKEKFKINFILFNNKTKIKIYNDYSTPTTLGVDRLAAAQGACSLLGYDKNIVIFDFGSAITIDFISKGRFKGGNISLGIALRFKALNDYTAKLPLGNLIENPSLIGNSTISAIENGVINSIIFEIKGYIELFHHEFEKINIIFTGGDAKYFANKLKNTIFAYSDLVLIGLNDILNNNL